MTATSLLDVLAKPGGTEEPIPALLESVVAGCLAEFDRLNDYERNLQIHKVTDPKIELEITEALWQLFRNWESGAEDVFNHARSIRAKGIPVPGIERLNDALGITGARLKLKPEQLVRARQDARAGRGIPMKELRDELNARIRA